MGAGGADLFPMSTIIPAVLRALELQVVLTASGHQTVDLPPAGRLIPTRDEGGVVHEA